MIFGIGGRARPLSCAGWAAPATSAPADCLGDKAFRDDEAIQVRLRERQQGGPGGAPAEKSNDDVKRTMLRVSDAPFDDLYVDSIAELG